MVICMLLLLWLRMFDVVPLDSCGVILGNPYVWDRDGIYYKILNKLQLVKDGKVFL